MMVMVLNGNRGKNDDLTKLHLDFHCPFTVNGHIPDEAGVSSCF